MNLTDFLPGHKGSGKELTWSQALSLGLTLLAVEMGLPSLILGLCRGQC